MREKRKSFKGIGLAGMILVAITCVLVFSPVDALSKYRAYSAAPPDQWRYDGKLQGGDLVVTFKPPKKTDFTLDEPVSVWIADLARTPVALATNVEFLGNNRFKATIPIKGVNVANRALYSVWYRIGQGESQRTSAVSLREVLGSMVLHVYGPSSYQVGTRGSLRVAITERHSNDPMKGVLVAANFVTKDVDRPLFEATTDSDGTFAMDFKVPDDLGDSAQILITAQNGPEKLEQTTTVTFKRTERILLTSDKPLYQPGQLIHIRALALSQATKKPIANTEAVIEVEDAKGNKVFKKKGRTDAFGIYSADFQLARELNMGTYRLRCTVGDHTADKTVEVKKYVLPKFKVEIKTDKKFYKPGEKVTGHVDAQYIFGKPVAGGNITLTGYASRVGAEQFAEIKGKIGEDGKYKFEMVLPEYFVGQNVDLGLARAQFKAKVVDKANHKQEALKSVTVSSSALNMIVVPESGSLVKGLPNRLFVMVSKPDGSPAKASLGDPWKEDVTHQTDSMGLAVLTTPEIKSGLRFKLKVWDEFGNNVEKQYNLRSRWDSTVLLRADRPVYRVGDQMTVSAFAASPASKTVYLDIINNGQTVLTRAEDIDDGKASMMVPVTHDMVGTLVLHAYIINPKGNMVRDTRIVYVNSKSDLQIGITPTRKTFRPGQKAAIDFEVTDNQGHPVAAALGVTIVDEAVFAMQDMQPGFEKVFFMLEKELMKPRFEFHSFTPDKLVQEKTLTKDKARGYEVMLASIEPAVSYGIGIKKFAPLTGDEWNEMQKQVKSDLKRVNKRIEELIAGGAKKTEAASQLTRDEITDPWGRQYALHYYENKIYQLRSDGPDRRPFTDDDVWAADEALSKKMNYRFARQGAKMKRGAAGFGGARLEGAMPPPAAMPMAGNGIMMDMAVAEEAEFLDEDLKDAEKSEVRTRNDRGGGKKIRVRKYFPETLYNNPALLTDGNGKARIQLDMADSITTWRIGAMANSAGGLLGSGTAPVVVFQDFFVDIDFPVALTRNDEVTVPIALYNYLKKSQTIKLTLEKGNWYKLLDGKSEWKVKMKPGEVRAVNLRLKAMKVGDHSLTIFAKGSKLSDAVKRTVEVIPDGKKIEQNFSDKLDGNVQHEIYIPENAIEDASKLFIKIYPGLMSQVIEGLDSIFRMPGGCFEQTSSTTYPNIMVLDYMKTTGKITPQIRMKAEGFINQGYQRLLSFEVNGGGFEWFGKDPAHKILTAYGLMEFYDMSRVHNVDPNVITRTARWLMNQQKADGSWEPTKRVLDTVAKKFTTDVVRNTAYIAWALGKSEQKGAALDKALAYLQKNMGKAEDAYTLALILNAFAYSEKHEKAFDTVLDRLMGMRKSKDGATFWQAKDTSIGSAGTSAMIETTALIGQALILKDRAPQVVNNIIKYLAQNKDTFGNWHSTQATVYALKVLIMSAEKSVGNVNGEVSVTVNGQSAGGVSVTPENADVVKFIDASHLLTTGKNVVNINFGGEGQTMYQVIGRHFAPWAGKPSQIELITIDVDYDKTTLKADDTVTCKVKIKNHRKGDFGMVLIDLGVPPGFDVMTGDLAELVGSGTIQKFETTGRQVIVYIEEVKMGKPIAFQYRLKARYPVKAQAPSTTAYEYYNPAVKATTEPVHMVVTE